MLTKLLPAIALVLLPAMAEAADITGVPKIHDGDQIVIGSSRIRLRGIDAPSVDQLCLNNAGERWTCGVAARDELIHHTDKKSWTCHVERTDRRGRNVAQVRGRWRGHPEMAGGERLGAGLCQVRHDYEADEKAAREAKAGMWQGAFIAPWDWRIRNKKTVILGAAKPPANAHAILLASASGPVAPSPECTIKGNVNGAGECIYHTPASRWYAQIKMQVSQGHALVLFGRGRRGRRLSRNQAIERFRANWAPVRVKKTRQNKR